jgi:hypothetical protein
MDDGATKIVTASARDSALRRLRRLQRAAVVGGVAMAAGFAVLAHAATPPYQKRRAAEVTLVAPARHQARRVHTHHPHHHHHRVSIPPAAAPAPAPARVQPPPAAPAPTRRPPVATSGGS